MNPRKEESCCNTQASPKEYAPDGNPPSDLRGSGSDHSHRLRKQLWDRQHKLQHEMNEVQEALNILNNDETVNKVLKVFEVAGK